MYRRLSTASFSQSYGFMAFVTIVSLAGIFLMNIGMGAGIRMNVDYTLHPYSHFMAWRYGLAAALPSAALATIWMYRARSDITGMDFLSKLITGGNVAFLAITLGWEVVILTQCNDPDGTYVYDHPQCINRNTPIDQTPDISWIFMFAGIITNTACGLYLAICSFTIEQSELLDGYHRDRYLKMGTPGLDNGGYVTTDGPAYPVNASMHHTKKSKKRGTSDGSIL